jgi:UPF0755 protein
MTWLAKTVFVGVIGSGIVGTVMYWQFQQPLLTEGKTTLIDLPYGATIKTVASILREQRIAYTWQTRLAGKWYLQGGSKLKAGHYALEGPLYWNDLFAKLSKGEADSMTITLVEGKRWADFKVKLKQNAYLVNTGWLNTSEEQIANALQKGRNNWICPPGVLEGCLMANTYAIYAGMPVQEILLTAYKKADATVRSVWHSRDPSIPLESPYELLTLASIVEKETGHDEDRPKIARVFLNRLEQGMRLQSDPTVIYGAYNYNGNLTRNHLHTDHAFNTYTRQGLTPTPIAAVSRASLEAVAHPAPGKWLYFVARPDKSTAFSNSLSEHNRAVWEYQIAPNQNLQHSNTRSATP